MQHSVSVSVLVGYCKSLGLNYPLIHLGVRMPIVTHANTHIGRQRRGRCGSPNECRCGSCSSAAASSHHCTGQGGHEICPWRAQSHGLTVVNEIESIWLEEAACTSKAIGKSCVEALFPLSSRNSPGQNWLKKRVGEKAECLARICSSCIQGRIDSCTCSDHGCSERSSLDQKCLWLEALQLPHLHMTSICTHRRLCSWAL